MTIRELLSFCNGYKERYGEDANVVFNCILIRTPLSVDFMQTSEDEFHSPRRAGSKQPRKSGGK